WAVTNATKSLGHPSGLSMPTLVAGPRSTATSASSSAPTTTSVTTAGPAPVDVRDGRAARRGREVAPGGDHRVSLPPRQARSRAEHARDRTVRPGPDGAASGPGSRSRAQRAPAQDRLLTRWAWPGPRPGRGSGGAHRPAWRT